MRRGFSIVELMVVISIMLILVIVSTVNIVNRQVDARDTERKEDIETITTHLETYYESGKDDSTSPPGQYPSTLITTNLATMHTYLRDIDDSSLVAPGSASPTSTFISASSGAGQTPTTSQYIYQPLQSDGTLCTNDTLVCSKFIIYSRLEKDSSIYTVKSKNQ